MVIARQAELLTAAGYLCSAADNLRAVGLPVLAAEIEAFIVSLERRLRAPELSARHGLPRGHEAVDQQQRPSRHPRRPRHTL
jgi:hypothetical protein